MPASRDESRRRRRSSARWRSDWCDRDAGGRDCARSGAVTSSRPIARVGRIALCGRGRSRGAAAARACTRRVRCACAFPNADRGARSKPSRQHRRRHGRRRPLRHRHRRSAPARGLSSPRRPRKRSIARSDRTPTIDVKLEVGGRRRAGLAAAGDDPVRPRAARAARSRSISRRRARMLLAEAVVFGRIGHGRGGRRGHACSTAGACGAPAGSSLPRRIRLDGAIARASSAERAVAGGARRDRDAC